MLLRGLSLALLSLGKRLPPGRVQPGNRGGWGVASWVCMGKASTGQVLAVLGIS